MLVLARTYPYTSKQVLSQTTSNNHTIVIPQRQPWTRTNCYMLVRSKTLVVRVKTLAN